jgi:hypothetical protein
MSLWNGITINKQRNGENISTIDGAAKRAEKIIIL